jgi:hypothetical protein
MGLLLAPGFRQRHRECLQGAQSAARGRARTTSMRSSSVRRKIAAAACSGSLSGACSARSSFMMRLCRPRDPAASASAFFASSYVKAPRAWRSKVPVASDASAARYAAFTSASLLSASKGHVPMLSTLKVVGMGGSDQAPCAL